MENDKKVATSKIWTTEASMEMNVNNLHCVRLHDRQTSVDVGVDSVVVGNWELVYNESTDRDDDYFEF